MELICSNCQKENDGKSKYCSNCGYNLPIIEMQNLKSEVDVLKEPKPKRKFNIKTIIGFIVGFGVMFFATQFLFKPSIDKQLEEMATVINATCPLTVDEYTTLNNVQALPNKIVQYNYTLIGMTKAEVKMDTVKKYFFPAVLQNVKTNPGMKTFRDNKVTLKYKYSDKNGVYTMEYIIKPEMYQ